ncbi:MULTISPECIES: nuclear transport factor 2 family protein [Pseudomonas]|uniref:nuclear transport factor 2 family protein n=1 Tax=Pseudomonas TaxID=286 RepID=UPI000720DB68|nr:MULTISPECIES: nuclear transport factor 2 family protein [Pseudomonas]ALQ02612.1 hypothetical protein AK973_2163 [Pseudomonas brassicacearum]
MNPHYRRIVEAYYLSLYSTQCDDAISNYLSDDYVEHQYTAGFTKSGLAKYVKQRVQGSPEHQVVIHHVLGQTDFIFLFVEEKLGDNQDIARAELFRLQDDRIAEHWGGQVVDEKNRKNANGTFDGTQVNRNVDYARQYVEGFEALDLMGFNEQQLDAFYESRTLDYKQHSPKGADGLIGLVDVLTSMKESGIKMTMQPKRVMVDGDFILCHRLYDTEPKHPLVNRINTFDMFRINAEGKAVEHWDVMEDVPGEEWLTKMY